jgi:hypothetical protein
MFNNASKIAITEDLVVVNVLEPLHEIILVVVIINHVIVLFNNTLIKNVKHYGCLSISCFESAANCNKIILTNFWFHFGLNYF